MESALMKQPPGLVAEEAIKQRLSELFDQANKGCGLSWELFAQLFSASVDSHFASDDVAVRTAAISMATDMGYQTPEQISILLQELEDDGCCSHGLDPDCCPCGCGDLSWFEPELDEFEPVPGWISESDLEYDEVDPEPPGIEAEPVLPPLGRWARLRMWLKSCLFGAAA